MRTVLRRNQQRIKWQRQENALIWNMVYFVLLRPVSKARKNHEAYSNNVPTDSGPTTCVVVNKVTPLITCNTGTLGCWVPLPVATTLRGFFILIQIFHLNCSHQMRWCVCRLEKQFCLRLSVSDAVAALFCTDTYGSIKNVIFADFFKLYISKGQITCNFWKTHNRKQEGQHILSL